MSLLSGLYTGASGLVTSQNALNTTAHNLSNINTLGYTRQQVTQGNRHYDTIGEAYVSPQQVGLGVSYSDVRSVRDYFLDKAYRLENGRSDFYRTSYDVITEIETMFGEMEGVAFQESLQELERAVEELQKNPSDATNQGLLVSKATTFLERSQAVYDGLVGYQDNLNEQVKGLVDDINTYAEKVFDLNQQIQAIESGKIERANDLRDARDLILDKLSGLGKIVYDEDINGIVTIQFEGVDLVNGDYVNKMGYIEDEETKFVTPVWERYGNQEVFSKTEKISSYIDTDVGALKALLLSRGDQRGTYRDVYRAQDYLDDYKREDLNKPATERRFFGNSTPPNQTVKDEDIITMITPELNELYNSTTARSTMVTVMAEFDNLIHGIVTGMNNILEIQTAGAETETTKDDEYIRLFSQITRPEDDDVVEYKNLNGETVRIISASMKDTTDGWSTKNLMINTDVQQTPSKLNNGFILKDKSVDQTAADKLVALFENDFDTLNPNTRTRLTFYEYYTNIVGENAIRGQSYKNISDNQKITVESLENQRQQVVGVSDNEELTNMIRYQNAYNASSRYINTVNAMLDTLLNSLA